MFNPAPKPTKRKKTKQSRITQRVREEVLRRSECKCERCGRSRCYAFEMAHLKQASQMGKGNTSANVVLLCGPSVNSSTCHHWVDSTSDGRKWREDKRKELIDYYAENTR